MKKGYYSLYAIRKIPNYPDDVIGGPFETYDEAKKHASSFLCDDDVAGVVFIDQNGNVLKGNQEGKD